MKRENRECVLERQFIERVVYKCLYMGKKIYKHMQRIKIPAREQNKTKQNKIIFHVKLSEIHFTYKTLNRIHLTQRQEMMRKQNQIFFAY